MISIEAMICFLVFVILLGIIAAGIGEQIQLFDFSSGAFIARNESEKCAVLVDALYSNGGGTLNENKFGCFISENGISSKFGDWEKASLTVSNSAVQVEGDLSMIEVNGDGHYR
ncbi:MAG: hypothetical protein ABID38_01015 [Candidatus Diapherotrites archaeon]